MKNRIDLILSFIKNNENCKSEQIISYVNTEIKSSRATILRDLNQLIFIGKIRKTGLSRNTCYNLAFNLDDYFRKEQDERVLKHSGFNFDIWDEFENLFTTEELNCLESLNNRYKKSKENKTQNFILKEFERITIEFAWKSSHIEGNTYTLLDTERLIKENKQAQGKTRLEANQILNHKYALSYIFENKEIYKKISKGKIIDIHNLLTKDLEINPNIRNHRVGIIGTNYSPLDNSYQINDAIDNLVKKINKLDNPTEKAFLSLIMISYIQPF